MLLRWCCTHHRFRWRRQCRFSCTSSVRRPSSARRVSVSMGLVSIGLNRSLSLGPCTDSQPPKQRQHPPVTRRGFLPFFASSKRQQTLCQINQAKLAWRFRGPQRGGRRRASCTVCACRRRRGYPPPLPCRPGHERNLCCDLSTALGGTDKI